MDNTSFGGFSAGPAGIQCWFTLQLLAEFWTSVDWPPYLPDLHILYFAIWHVLQAKSKLHLKLIRPSAESDVVTVGYFIRTCG
jgi:hypothetical protein